MESNTRLAKFFALVIPVAAILTLAAQAIAADAVRAAITQSITMNAGETRVIQNLNPDAVPGVAVISNPHAMMLHNDTAGKLVILGAEEGRWNISVKRADGQDVTYDVTVHSIEDWSKGPNPGHAPVPASAADSGAPAAVRTASAATSGSAVSTPGTSVTSASIQQLRGLSGFDGCEPVPAVSRGSVDSDFGPGLLDRWGHNQGRCELPARRWHLDDDRHFAGV
jgi:hypothetical protein